MGGWFSDSLSLSPQVRTNYGKFNIRFTGVKVWNSIDDKLKTLKKLAFKKKLKDSLIIVDKTDRLGSLTSFKRSVQSCIVLC